MKDLVWTEDDRKLKEGGGEGQELLKGDGLEGLRNMGRSCRRMNGSKDKGGDRSRTRQEEACGGQGQPGLQLLEHIPL